MQNSTIEGDRNGYGLALHTTSSQLGLAMDNFHGDRRVQTWNLGRELSTQLNTHLMDFVKPQSWKDFKFIAAAKGPGSFTSTRIGLVTARILAQQLDLPLFGISTLAAVAQSYQQSSPGETPIAVQLPARRSQLFVAIYQPSASDSLEPLLGDRTTTPEQWQQTREALGSEYRLITPPEPLGDTVTSILDLAARAWQAGDRPHWSSALPYYGQHPVES